MGGGKMNKETLFKDKRGIEGLPMRLIIILVIAVAVIAALMALLGSFHPKGTLSVECVSCQGNPGNLATISGTGEQTLPPFEVVIKVTDSNGDPVDGASVTLTGANGAGSGKTGSDGQATITVTGAKLNANENEESMKVTVTASGYHKYTEEDFVIIART